MKRFIQGCVLIFLILSLCACAGDAQAGGADAPDVLHVTRTIAITGFHFAPLDVAIRDATQVRALYQAASVLQAVPKDEVLHCPMDNGLEYHLDFLRGTSFDQAMQLDATGCQLLDLNAAGYDLFGVVSTHDVCFTTPAFRDMFAKMLHLSALFPLANI